jgi:hypothetical protein
MAVYSLAHDWVAVTGDKEAVRCTRCGLVTRIGRWDVPRCAPHFESERSGFTDEADEDERE